MNPPKSFALDKEEWEFFYNALANMQLGVEAKDAKSRRLRAALGMTRILITQKIKGWNGRNTIDISLLVGSLKTIRRLAREFEYCGIKKTEFQIFLELLLDKFEKQRLQVKKPRLMLSELNKLKGVVSSDPLRGTDED